jgi:hypothetical protein
MVPAGHGGRLWVDTAGGGGTILNIRSAIFNGGTLRIGNETLSAPSEITASAIINGGPGAIHLVGSTANQAGQAYWRAE